MAGQHTGRSIHIGLDAVDPAEYHTKEGKGWDGALSVAETDAQDMASLAKAQGFETSTLLTKEATAENILGSIHDAAQALRAGDFFLLTFSGHGGQVPDLSGEEKDGKDETWVAYDRQIIDDEMYAAYGTFAPGVRMLVISDSCHSGSVWRQPRMPFPDEDNPDVGPPKLMPAEVAEADLERRGAQYQELATAVPRAAHSKQQMRARLLVWSACKDDELGYTGASNSILTYLVLTVWDEGRFEGDYDKFFQEMLANAPSYQTPRQGMRGPNHAEFLAERPFTINPSP